MITIGSVYPIVINERGEIIPTGVETIVRDLQASLYPEFVFDLYGMWYDYIFSVRHGYPQEREVKKMVALREEEKPLFKKDVIQLLSKLPEESQLLHINTYSIDQDFVRKLRDLHEAGFPVVYTVHSLAFLDFVREPKVRTLLGFSELPREVEEDFLSKFLPMCSLHLKEEEANDRIKDLIHRLSLKCSVNKDFISMMRIGMYMTALQREIMSFSDVIVFNSNFMQNEANKRFPSEFIKKGVVIPNGTDFYLTYDQNKDIIDRNSLEWRSRYFPNKRLIGYIGRIVEYKGVLELAKAFDILSQKYGMRDVALVFVGPGSNEIYNKIKSNAGRSANKVFISLTQLAPKDPALHTVYRALDVCVYPSKNEPFGLVPIEATSIGTITIVRDCDNLHCFVEEGICMGYRGGADELAATLHYVLSNYGYQKEKVEQARRLVIEKYSLGRMSSNYSRLFKNLLSKR
ncbi:MAG: glycosyltransferase family 4 protein [Candidatus Aenigmatarchaeota archaeon]|nr:glycosyltransferase family 4 protein [Candidatus Aenigmarchaeota archaeon]